MLCVCACACVHAGASPPQYKARPLERAGPDTLGPAGGREGCLEEGTLGSTLKGEEKQGESILYTGKRPVNCCHCQHWEGQETRLELQVTPEEPEFHPKGKRHLGKVVRSVARTCHPGSEIGPTWHRAKGLHGEGTRVSILFQPQTVPQPLQAGILPFRVAASTTWAEIRSWFVGVTKTAAS